MIPTSEQLALYAGDTTRRIVNVASVKHRSPFRYPGGKTWFVPYFRRWIDQLPSRPHRLIEPFAGGAIVGLSTLFDERVDELLIVELDEDVASVWQTILSRSAQPLVNRILEFDPTRENAAEILKATPRSRLDRAFQTIVRNRMQHGGIMAPGASLIRNGENGKGAASRWYPETLARRILAIHERRSQISAKCTDAFEALARDQITDDCAVFIDPPYTAGENGKRAGRRLYKHHTIDHDELFARMSLLKSPFLMTYDDDPCVLELARRFDFHTDFVPMKNTHHAKMNELVISNVPLNNL